jgi:adenosylhomocysteine nucleosidase
MWQSLLRSLLFQAVAEQARSARETTEPTQSNQSDAPAAANGAAAAQCDIGCVFALSIEAGGLVDRLSQVTRLKGNGFLVRTGALAGQQLAVIEAGVGQSAAANGARLLLAGHRPRWMISAGFAGGLHPELRPGDIFMADRLMDSAGRALAVDFKISPSGLASSPGLHVGRLLTADRVIADPEEKRRLCHETGAAAVDMETFAVAEVCREQRIRFLSIRVISDAAEDALPPDIEFLVRRKTALGRLGAATRAVTQRPGSVKDLWRLREAALKASDRLAKFLAGVVPQLD